MVAQTSGPCPLPLCPGRAELPQPVGHATPASVLTGLQPVLADFKSDSPTVKMSGTMERSGRGDFSAHSPAPKPSSLLGPVPCPTPSSPPGQALAPRADTTLPVRRLFYFESCCGKIGGVSATQAPSRCPINVDTVGLLKAQSKKAWGRPSATASLGLVSPTPGILEGIRGHLGSGVED